MSIWLKQGCIGVLFSVSTGLMLVACKGPESSPALSESPGRASETSVRKGKESAKMMQVLRDLGELKAAMLRYRGDVGELPPRGDYCPACMALQGEEVVPARSGKEPRPHMNLLEHVLMEKDGRGWDGPYLNHAIPRDPWGMEYTYDDNDVGSGPAAAAGSSLHSAGPDRVYGTADDVVVSILSQEEARRR